MGGKTSTTTSQVKIPQEVLDRYNAVNLNAEAVAKNPFQKYGTTAEDFVAPINEQQLSGISNVNAAAGSYQPFLAGATGATVSGMDPAYAGIDNYMSPYVKNVADTTGAMMRQQFEQAQSGNLGTAASSGAFGGDRAGIAAANLQQQNQMAYGKTMADVMNQGYTQALGASQADLSRLLQGGQQLANLGQMAQGLGLQGAEAQINAGTLQQTTDQAGKTALINQFMQEQGYPFQVAQFLANIAMGTGALSGSTTTTTQPGSFFSDRRLKEDVKRIGKTDDGLPIYSFKYKGDDAEQTHIGFMADEVEKVKPEAVGLHPSGYKTVDYAKATENSMGGGVKPGHAGQGFANGGVAGPYGSSPGSQVDFGGYVPQAFLPVGELIVADPAIADASRQSMAQQLASIANLGENVKSLDETWQWAKDKWGSDPKADAVSEGEAARGVTKASGGAAYLKSEPSGGLVPNSAKSYLSDTLEGQNEDAKERSIMQPGSAPGQQASGASQLGSLLGGAGAAMSGFASIAPLLGISDRRAKHEIRRIGKTDDGMPIYKFKYKGDDREQTHVGFMADEVERKHPDAVSTGPDGMKRVDYSQADKFYQGGIVRSGYQVGGRPEEETMGEKISRLTAPARYAVTDSLPNAAMAVGSLPIAGLQGAAGLALGAVNQPEASSYMLDAARNSLRRSARFDRAANAPMPENLSPEEIRALNAPLSPEQIAAREAGSNMTMEPSRSNGVLPSEYGRLLMSPAASLPVGESSPMQFAAGDTRMDTAVSPMRSAVGDARMGAEASPMRFAAGDSRMNPGLAPASSVRPQARPEGLAPASSMRPVARPEGLGAASTSTAVQPAVAAPQTPAAAPYEASDASSFYYSRMVPQESGGRQFDKDGNPLRSPKGAVGAAQVMEATGPEAAALAGLDWDRDRWLNDRDYNLKLGEAYFLEQYRRFGSLDKAAAAYNAGPGALASAMDRATALGGSYLDYLPRETQNYVAATTGTGGLGGASLAPPADQRGLGAGILTSDKPYEDRTTLGKMFYNEDGTVNRNALLSLASGLGAMLSSPSQFFLPSLGLGLQGAASTYAGLEKQAADIALTKEEARRTNILADKDRIFEGQGGLMLINLGGGRPPVEIWDYLENPSAYSTGDRQLDAEILRQAQIASANAPRAEGVFADPGVQTLLERETENAERNPASARAESDAIERTINASASVARSSIPSILTRTDAVSALTSPDAAVRAGALGPLKQTVTNYLNDISQTLTQILGLPPEEALPTIIDPNGGDAAANAQIILKMAVETGMMNANGIQEMQTIMAAQPNEALAAETNSALMAALLVSGRADMRRADFMRDYKVQPNNPRRTVIDADQAFQETYGDQIVAEKAALKEIIHYGSQPMPPEWATILGDYKTPMEFLMTPGIPVEAKNEFIAKLLPALGVNEMVISALQGPSGVYIGNYFGG